MEVGGQHNAPNTLPPKENPDAHGTGGWVGRRAGLDVLEEMKFSCLSRESSPRIFQPVAYSLYRLSYKQLHNRTVPLILFWYCVSPLAV